jgi:hypothetical protein
LLTLYDPAAKIVFTAGSYGEPTVTMTLIFIVGW